MTTALTPEPFGSVLLSHTRRKKEDRPWCKEILLYSPANKGDSPESRALVYAEATVKPLLQRIEALEAELAACKKDAERYRWLRASDCLSYTSDTGPRPSSPESRMLYAIRNAGKKTSDMIEIRLLCYHLAPYQEPIWIDGEHFDYGANMDAAIDAAIAAQEKA